MPLQRGSLEPCGKVGKCHLISGTFSRNAHAHQTFTPKSECIGSKEYMLKTNTAGNNFIVRFLATKSNLAVMQSTKPYFINLPAKAAKSFISKPSDKSKPFASLALPLGVKLLIILGKYCANSVDASVLFTPA